MLNKREEYVLKRLHGEWSSAELENGPENELIECLVFFDFTPYEPAGMYSPGSSASLEITEVVRDDNYEEICLLPETKEEWEEHLLDDYLYRLRNDPRW